MVTEKDIIEDLNYKIEELRAYLNNPLDSSQDISDLSLRQIIDLEIDNKGYLIDYIEFEKLRAELKGIQSQKQKIIEEIKEMFKWKTCQVVNGNLPKERLKDFDEGYKCAEKNYFRKLKELLKSIGEKEQ